MYRSLCTIGTIHVCVLWPPMHCYVHLCTTMCMYYGPRCTAMRVYYAPRCTAMCVYYGPRCTAMPVYYDPRCTAMCVYYGPRCTAMPVYYDPRCTAMCVYCWPTMNRYVCVLWPTLHRYVYYGSRGLHCATIATSMTCLDSDSQPHNNASLCGGVYRSTPWDIPTLYRPLPSLIL